MQRDCHRGLLGVALVVATSLGLGAAAERAPTQRRGGLPAAADTADDVTFSQDIAPLLVAHCAGCHRPGAIAPFALLSYDDVRPWARAIKQATRTRSMPPWKPEPGYGNAFVGDPRLSDAQIALIARWVDAGAPEGNPTDLAPLPGCRRQAIPSAASGRACPGVQPRKWPSGYRASNGVTPS